MFVYTNLNIPSRSMLITCLLTGSFFLSTAFAEVKIDHKPVKQASSGQRIDLSAKFNDKSAGISKAFAYFNSDQDKLWHSVPMVSTGTKYGGQLPAPDIHTSTVNYRFLVVNNKNKIQTGEVHTINIKKDDKALARLQRKPPTDIKIDVSEIQDAKDLVKKAKQKRVSKADREKEANRSTRPNPNSRIYVRSEYKPGIDSLNGFKDYVNMYYSPNAYGVTAGIVDASATVTGAGAGTSAGPMATASIWSNSVLLGGAAVLGGAVVLGGSSSSSGNSGTSSTSSAPVSAPVTAPGAVTNFAGSWSGPSCPTGPARYVVSLSQTGSAVSGSITFHKCPGGGRAGYSVTGTATASSTLTLSGTKVSGQGALGGTAPGATTFTITKGGAPSPRFD